MSANDIYIHPSANVSDKASIGTGTKVWINVQIRESAVVGEDCILSKDVYIDHAVKIGSRCKIQNSVSVYNGVEIGDALDRDRVDRALPVWQGCRVIAPGELFLMNSGVRDSLDGRYFGPLPASAVIGRALPLWTDEDGDGRFVWRAPTR